MIYTSLFIRRCFNACVSLYSRVLLILNRVAWLVLLFGFSLINGNGFDFGLSVRVKILTHYHALVLVYRVEVL